MKLSTDWNFCLNSKRHKNYLFHPLDAVWDSWLYLYRDSQLRNLQAYFLLKYWRSCWLHKGFFVEFKFPNLIRIKILMVEFIGLKFKTLNRKVKQKFRVANSFRETSSTFEFLVDKFPCNGYQWPGQRHMVLSNKWKFLSTNGLFIHNLDRLNLRHAWKKWIVLNQYFQTEL